MADAAVNILHNWFMKVLSNKLAAAENIDIECSVTPQPNSPFLLGEMRANLNSLTTKVAHIMATLADIQAILSSDEAAEQKLITLVQSQAATMATLQAQLADALANGDGSTIATIVAQMKTDADAMTAAADAASGTTPTPPVVDPAPVTDPVTPQPVAADPAPTPDPVAPAPAPPSQPVVS